ncbi:MAG: dehydrogenase [Gracilibacter sp. BRH_c7a]|nr:MAG: dehydrogenase [Gracilibacter sp. BRH_c7a]
MPTDYKIFRNVCPRNCYDTCGIISYVKNGELIKVEGDPKHGYTKGRLCAKGYAYTQYVYSPDRLRYPLRQYPRGSGTWERISWEQAIEIIADKILELNKRYGSNLALAHNKFSGNLGLLHYAVEGMFNSMGEHTKTIGNACLAAGFDAISYDFGDNINPDPEDMADSKLIVIWGANPAWTAIHQLSHINAAREKGAKVVVIDPLYTPTAAKADIFVQIRPSTDSLLALGIVKILMEQDKCDNDFIRDHTWGWEPFSSYVKEKISISLVREVTGITEEVIFELASLYGSTKPCANWVGFGLQRSMNGGQNTRAINALVGVTGNIGRKGGGLYYFNPTPNYFPQSLLNHPSPESRQPREVDINRFADDILSLANPPVKMLWVASRNPLSQDQNLARWQELLESLELVVTVDLFMTRTAEMSDLVLPATSTFENDDVNVGYWHYWLAINQKAIEPLYEAKSDLEIARILTRKLNELSPGFSDFPYELTDEDWISKEFTPKVLEIYGLANWEELKDGPRKCSGNKIPWEDRRFKTKTGKFELYSRDAKENELPAISTYNQPRNDIYPLRLLSPQHRNRLHSQYDFVPWLNDEHFDILKMNQKDARQRGIEEGDTVCIYNEAGLLSKKIKLSPYIPLGVVVASQGGLKPINSLMFDLPADMGMKESGSRGLAINDVYVECKKQVK